MAWWALSIAAARSDRRKGGQAGGGGRGSGGRGGQAGSGGGPAGCGSDGGGGGGAHVERVIFGGPELGTPMSSSLSLRLIPLSLPVRLSSGLLRPDMAGARG